MLDGLIGLYFHLRGMQSQIGGFPLRNQQAGVMPTPELISAGLDALEQAARQRHGRGFAELDGDEQDALLAEAERGALRLTPVLLLLAPVAKEILDVRYSPVDPAGSKDQFHVFAASI